jgi:hypothetical protein
MYPSEWYPVLTLVSTSLNLGGKVAAFTIEELDRIKRVSDEFEKCQKLISERFGLGDVGAYEPLVENWD